MKVVYNPNKNQEELFRVTCDNCESVMVFGTRTDDEILVYVCKDYDELWIPLKEED